MKRKLRLIMCLTMALTIIFGNVLAVSASEPKDDEVVEVVNGENSYTFDNYERNDDGEIVIRAYSYIPEEASRIGCGYSVANTFTLSSVCSISDLDTYIPAIYKWPYQSSYQFRPIIARVNNGEFEYGRFSFTGLCTTDDSTNQNNGKYVPFAENYENGKTFNINIPIFETLDDVKNYVLNKDDSGIINKPPLTDEEMIFNSDIPTPILVFDNDGGLGFQFNNASEDFYIEMRGRWWSVDDITLFKKNLIWKYSYESLIKNDLSTWISNTSCVGSENEHDLSDYGKESFENLLTLYPVDERNYSGGSNVLGNYFSGYNDAMTTLKMLLNEKTSSYNGCEVYVRYYTIDNNGNYYYGKWCHWLGNLANQEGSSGSVLDDENIYKGQQSGSGITDDDMEIIESSGNSRNDPDLKEEIYGEYESPITGISSSEFSAYFKQAIDIIKGLGGK